MVFTSDGRHETNFRFRERSTRTDANGSPTQCYERARSILQSGVMAGGRFILQEGNNLPPRVPLANLEAVYQACLEFGNYSANKEAII